MSEEPSGFRQKILKLRKPHRVVIQNEQTLEQKRSFRLTALNIYILLTTTLLVLTAIVVCLIFYTPIRKLVPGYRDIRKDEAYVSLTKQIDFLETQINEQDTYISHLRSRMTENIDDMSSALIEAPLESSNASTVQRIEEDAKLRKDMERQRILQKQAKKSDRISQNLFVTPVNGTISFEFLPEQEHIGIDILAPSNSPILASADGYVFMSDWTESQGNSIGVSHKNNTITFYKHNSVLLKKVGIFVRAGEAIAIIGNSGELTDGPHLHFEIWIEGKPVDPELYLNF